MLRRWGTRRRLGRVGLGPGVPPTGPASCASAGARGRALELVFCRPFLRPARSPRERQGRDATPVAVPPAGAGRCRRLRVMHGRAPEPPLQMGPMHAAARRMLTTKRRRAPRRARHGQQVVRRGCPRSIEVLRARQPAPGRRVSPVVDVALDRGADDGLRGPRDACAAGPLHASYHRKGAGELRRHSAAPGPARRFALFFRGGLGPAPGGEGSAAFTGCVGQPDAVPQPPESGPPVERAG